MISVISDATGRETTKSSEPNASCDLSELEESLEVGNDWKERTEADQAMKSGEIQALYSEKPRKESSPLTKVPEEERKQYTKIVFTEQDFTPVANLQTSEEEKPLYEEGPSTTCTDLSGEKEVQSEVAKDSEEDEQIEKNNAEISDTESQCDLNALEENNSGVESKTAPTAFIEATSTVESDEESHEKEIEKISRNFEEETNSKENPEKTFAAMFSKEMTGRVYFEHRICGKMTIF